MTKSETVQRADAAIKENLPGVFSADQLVIKPAATDPMSVGITALREAGLDPLRLWSLMAPKDAGGIVSAVFLQGDSRVVLMHQFPSGKFALFGKVTLDDVVELK